jgi:hypothetical protein
MLKFTKPKPAILFEDWLKVASDRDLWDFYLDMEEGSPLDLKLGQQVLDEVNRRQNAQSFMQRVWLCALIIGTLVAIAITTL